MEHSLNYRAVIKDPSAEPYQDEKTHAWMQPKLPQVIGGSPASLRVWAKQTLPTCSKHAYCEIYRVEETLVERVAQEPAVPAAQK
jgi:hypothetical protein